jgi:nucleoid-associated protein YgaU
MDRIVLMDRKEPAAGGAVKAGGAFFLWQCKKRARSGQSAKDLGLMAITPWKVLLFIIGGLGTAGTGAYYVVEREKSAATDEPMVAALPADPAAAQPGQAAPPQPAGVAQPGGAPAAAPSADGGAVLAPTFDLLRVEPDGSMVIAGRSMPLAGIEVVIGSKVIATTTANADREFVVVLDEPLEPGDYQIVLRSTSPDNVVATSLETALVSVPDSESGEVLALVEEPGRASRLITVPDGQAPAGSADAAPAAVAAASGDTPAAVPAADPQTAAAGAAQPVAAGETPPGDAATATATAAAETPAQAAAAPAGEVAGEAAGAVAAVLPETPAAAAVPAPAGETASAAVPGAPDAATDAARAAKPADGAGQVAMVEPAAKPGPAGAPQPSGAAQPDVRVEAVEIEGRSVFVAGMASPGLTVRVYANAILLGEALSSDAGRFLIETERDLPVGDYIVRADLLADGGRTVVARAAVPFQREAGLSVAAVAAPPTTEPPSAGASIAAARPEPAAPPAAAPAPIATMPAPLPTAEKPAGQPSGEAAGLAAAPAPQPVAPQPVAPPAAQLAAPRDAAPQDAAPQDAAAEVAAPQRAATDPAAPPVVTRPETSAASETAPSPAAPGTPIAPPSAAAAAGTETSPDSGEPAAPAGDSVAAASSEPAAADIVTVTAAPLQAVDGAVIIRRGDTLWRISRRVYGRGVRYSTIYMANQEQIEDPDRIWPGQVFRVPDKTSEGENAHLDAMGAQITTIEPAGVAR